MKLSRVYDHDKLYFNKYQYRLAIYNDYYYYVRTNDEAYISFILLEKSHIDKLHKLLCDIIKIKKFVSKNKDIRTFISHASNSVSIYSNDRESLLSLCDSFDQSRCKMWKVRESHAELLKKDKSVIITRSLGNFRFRITLGNDTRKGTLPIANWIDNNKAKVRVGKETLRCLRSERSSCSGLYFYVKDEKSLLIVQMLAGNKIRTINKLVDKKDLDK